MAGDPDPEGGWVDGAVHRGVEDQGFAVDPTGIWVVSASMMTWGPVRLVSPRELRPRSRPAAWAALLMVTANIPRVPRSSRARRPSPAMSPIP